MTLHTKVFIAGLLAATLPTMAIAQVVTQPVQGQQPAAVAVAADSQQQTQQAIAHALGMAIRGSELQFIAQSARGGRFQNQNADNNQNQNQNQNQNADNKNQKADNEGRPQNADNKQNTDNNQNRRDRDNANNDADNQGRQQAARQAVQQLHQQAWHQFESSTQLFQAANNDIRGLEGNAGQRGGDSSAWSRRLHTAASQYANTLRKLSGANNHPAGSLGGQIDQDQTRRGDQDQDRGQNRREGGNLSRAEIAQATLINHAVCEVLAAYQLTQATGANRVTAQTTAGQQLQTHARQMTAEGQQILQAVIASANARNDNDANNRNDDKRNNDANNRNENNRDNARGGQEAEGQASVRALAQQAQQVIDTLQRISGNASAPAGAETPGAVR